MKLAKLHGLGNDFLVLNAGEILDQEAEASELARILCRRHTGVGADGMMLFRPTVRDEQADVSALIYNADGSRAEMSGNGTRCLAAFLIHSGLISADVIRIRTVSGIRTFQLRSRSQRIYFFTSSMGIPVTDPALMSLRLQGVVGPAVNLPLAVGPETVPVTLSSMGNPHCSTFWPDVADAPVERLGPVLERHGVFPDRTNVEFIQVVDRHHIRVRFWERGAGPTLASGTGSAAAAVASILNGYADSPLTVEVAMGTLEVEWQPPGELSLAGPAEFVCSLDFPYGEETAQ